MSDVGQMIRKIRIKRDLSQYKLAQLSGVAQPTINAIEREDQTRSPAVDTVQKIAKALDCPVSVLLGEKEDKYDPTFTIRETALISVFRQLNTTGKQLLEAQAEALLSQPTLRQEGHISRAE